jgi:hypothetical protein
VKKLENAALLMDFWLGQGVRAAAIPAAVLPMLCIALRAAFGRLSPFARLSRPSNAGQAKKTRNPVGREQERQSGRVARPVTARCGDAPLRAACQTAFLALARRLPILSQVPKRPSVHEFLWADLRTRFFFCCRRPPTRAASPRLTVGVQDVAKSTRSM